MIFIDCHSLANHVSLETGGEGTNISNTLAERRRGRRLGQEGQGGTEIDLMRNWEKKRMRERERGREERGD